MASAYAATRDRPAPYLAHEHEVCLAGSAVMAPDLIEGAITICPPAALIDHTCRTVYAAVATLEARGYGATPGRVLIHLDAIGARVSPDVLDEITESVPTGVHICYFARLVAEAATRRALGARLESLTAAAMRGEPIDHVLTSLVDLARDCAVAA